MLCDESLEYWGAVFVAARILEHGITFCEFLEDPWKWLKALGLPSAPLGLASDYRPLLPRQVNAAQALWRRWDREAN